MWLYRIISLYSPLLYCEMSLYLVQLSITEKPKLPFSDELDLWGAVDALKFCTGWGMCRPTGMLNTRKFLLADCHFIGPVASAGYYHALQTNGTRSTDKHYEPVNFQALITSLYTYTYQWVRSVGETIVPIELQHPASKANVAQITDKWAQPWSSKYVRGNQQCVRRQHS